MKKENIFWGCFLVIAAVFLIVSKMGFLAGVSIFTIFWTIIFAAALIKGIFERSFGMILFPIAFLCILYDDFLKITELTPWTVLLAALLLDIGLNMLFKHHKKKKINFIWEGSSNDSKKNTSCLSGENIYVKNSFSGSSKYVESDNLKEAVIENSFGELNIYFDKARIQEETAKISVDSSFGDINIYVPGEWNVINNISTSFADFNEKGHCNTTGRPTVYINGSVTFGDGSIYYI